VPRVAPVALKNVTASSEPTPAMRLEEAPPPAAPATEARPSGPSSPGVSLLLEFDGDSWAKIEADGRTVLTVSSAAASRSASRPATDSV
jgi:hypothetical protein